MTILTNEKVTWRGYQKQLIERLPKYKENRAIHLVAPPGSGKTYLGIEIIRQLDNKTLVLVPSLVLKQQWIKTIKVSFLKKTADQTEISDTIDSLKEITVETYQTMYSRLKNDPTFLERERIAVIVLDEAHHLKKNWGEVLLSLKTNVPELVTVSLTATPPYDADGQEWHQYQLLNGPIDEEIAIPQLIEEKVLAPHQDYLYLVSAPRGVVERYEEFMESQSDVVETIVASTEISDFLLEQGFIQKPKEHESFIYQSFDVYLSALLFLHLHGYQLEEEHWSLLGMSKAQGQRIAFPPIEKRHMIDLLTYLYDSQPELSLFKYLEEQGWVAQNQLQLFPTFSQTIVNQAPIEKKEAICRILLCEHEKLGADLCGLVLTDFIKKDVLDGKYGELEYGLVPIFDYVVPFLREELNIAAVCGEFLIVPKEFQHFFSMVSRNNGDHPYFTEYGVIYPMEQKRSEALTILTRLVDKKRIQLLIGTSSLLGEGWDCPALNTLILANQTASFVQTQQLRGRGLRINESGKTTNIWHLAVVVPELDFSKQIDLNRIMKRMGYVCGLTFGTQPTIESGIERFDLLGISSGKEIAVYNQEMLYWSSERKQLAQRWEQALKKGSHLTMPLIIRKSQSDSIKNKQLIIKLEGEKGETGTKYFAKIGIAILSIMGMLSMFTYPLLGSLILGVDSVVVLVAYNIDKILESYHAYTKRKAWQKEIKYIRSLAFSITETLVKLNRIEPIALDRIVVEASDHECSCHLAEASYQEERLFHTTMKEVLSEVQNPRYFICLGKGTILSVPDMFSQNKKTAKVYQSAIDHYFSVKSDLVYSRSLEGRRRLVQAKVSKYYLDKDSYQNELIQKRIWN